jgi:hypothetical protein
MFNFLALEVISRRRSCDGGEVQCGGIVSRHEGVNGRSSRGYADPGLENGPAVVGGDGFSSVCMRCSLRIY